MPEFGICSGGNFNFKFKSTGETLKSKMFEVYMTWNLNFF